MSNPSDTKSAATQTVDSDEIVPEMPDERALHLQIIEDGDYSLIAWYGPERAKESLLDIRQFAESHGLPCTRVKMLIDKLDRGLIKWN
ncbi:hypothetical protein niasHS_012026 [Heterodera schachtii]|uniref:Uncharacterized protein n=1 Tax=Heterodera schachtii TaxID=97005 RepID=A0ABD2IKK2_HETSC